MSRPKCGTLQFGRMRCHLILMGLHNIMVLNCAALTCNFHNNFGVEFIVSVPMLCGGWDS